MKKLKRRYYILKTEIRDTISLDVRVISIDTFNENPWKDPVARPLLEAKIFQACMNWNAFKLRRVSYSDEENNVNDPDLKIQLTFFDVDDGEFEETWKMDYIELI